jgi:hypothetical protein
MGTYPAISEVLVHIEPDEYSGHMPPQTPQPSFPSHAFSERLSLIPTRAQKRSSLVPVTPAEAPFRDLLQPLRAALRKGKALC